MKINRNIFIFIAAALTLLNPSALFGETLTLNFYNSSGTSLSFSQVQSTQIGSGVGAYAADAFIDPTTLCYITSTPWTSAGGGAMTLPGQPVAFAINWPTATQGYGLVIVDNGGNGYSTSTNVNFTYQAAKDTKRKLDAALTARPDYPKSTAFKTAYNAATNYLFSADQSGATESVKGAQGQLALDQLVVAYDLMLKEYGPLYARFHQTTTPTWLGFTIEDLTNYQADLDKLVAMAGPYAWVRFVFQSGTTPADYTNAVNYAKAKGIKVLGLPVDSSADKNYTRTTYFQRCTNFIAALPTIDAWEVGNEVSGNWLSSDIAGRIADVAAYCKVQGKKTYLTLFWQLNGTSSTVSMFNWIATNLPPSVRSNLDYVGISQYQEQAPMGAAFDQVMRRLQVEFPSQQIGLGELGYWIAGQRFWWAYSTNATTGKDAVLEQYYKASLGYAGAQGGCFWWNFASGVSSYDFDSTMTKSIVRLKNYLCSNFNNYPTALTFSETNGLFKVSWLNTPLGWILDNVTNFQGTNLPWIPVPTSLYQTNGNYLFYTTPLTGKTDYQFHLP